MMSCAYVPMQSNAVLAEQTWLGGILGGMFRSEPNSFALSL